ncbi:MAG: hypothetical protein KF780_00745 [Sphingomonas sp.]|nr:hypothetical protein [Sphingomonas sp.]
MILLAAGLTASCIHAPPEIMVADRTWAPNRTGYTFRAGYFSEPQVYDARWEQGRLRMMREQGASCGPIRGRIVRRDIRWYAATPQSGRRCAALVYTVSCGRENPLVRRTAEEMRRELLAVEPRRPIEPECGIKDYYFFHPEDCPAVQYAPAGCRHHPREEPAETTPEMAEPSQPIER